MNKAINIIEWVVWILALSVDATGLITASIGDSLANYTITFAGLITLITGIITTVLTTCLTIARLVLNKFRERVNK